MKITCNEIIITKPLKTLSVGDTFFDMESGSYNMVITVNPLVENEYVTVDEDLLKDDNMIFAVDLTTGEIYPYWKENEVRPIRLEAQGHF